MAYESSSFFLSIKDHSSELTTTRVNIGLVTAANLAARITARDAFIDAVEGVINGVIQDSGLSLDKKFNTGAPGNQNSIRELKLLIVMEDTTTMRTHTFTIGTLDQDQVVFIPGTDRVDMDQPNAAALKTAINNFVVSPAGNTILVKEMIRVGRNL